MCLVSIVCIFQALYGSCQKIKNRSRKSWVMEWKRTVFFVCHFKMSDFSIQILTSCLWSVIAPKRIDRFWCAWYQSLAFLKLYMIHVKQSKIIQEKVKLWGVRKSFHFICAALFFSRSNLKPMWKINYSAAQIKWNDFLVPHNLAVSWSIFDFFRWII